MLPEPLFHSLSPMNPEILEYVHAIREEKHILMENLIVQYIQVVSPPHVLGT